MDPDLATNAVDDEPDKKMNGLKSLWREVRPIVLKWAACIPHLKTALLFIASSCGQEFCAVVGVIGAYLSDLFDTMSSMPIMKEGRK